LSECARYLAIWLNRFRFMFRAMNPNPEENKNGQTQAFGRSKRLSSLQASMSSRMNFSTLRFAPSYP